MEANESYYPFDVYNGLDSIKNSGISIRDKLAHDYFKSMLQGNYMNGFSKCSGYGIDEFGRTSGYQQPDYESLLDKAFELADLFIKKSKENENK